ncbi:flagellar inner arm dynein 1 heavy chain alpha [Chlorella sorokiniana]|uniref:Flagellar inner arm dynein 1 heavy chain alpha n=1 Tax=Chlorella sorokiniana TaxID=3076 RepID=A0A2P6TQW4_CHLSO|nr:flagellar inner arm dynein 1 heavy chain alpha [Chlorella sorokiniana]|eukprot:PRW56454.1 flagellar inner arm dynein 1 heavy chain alpha [Chlorella sorokiniana]
MSAAQLLAEAAAGLLGAPSGCPTVNCKRLGAWAAGAQGDWQLHACEPHAIPSDLLGCPAVGFLRPSCAPAAGPLQLEEVQAAAAAAILLPEGPSLTSLHQLLQHVVAPLLEAQQEEQQQGQPGAWQLTSGGAAAASTAELLAAPHRFAAQVAAAAKHCSSEAAVVRLPVLPPGLELADTAAAAASEEAVLACEQCMEEWVQAVAELLQREGTAQPEGPSPLAELAHWQARAEAYGGLLEQLSVPAVRAAQAVVQRGSMDANLAAGFHAQLTELTRLALEARDNARILATMERHLRVLEAGSMQAAADALAPMLNALRMIWVISRHYSDDVHMSGLLERIAGSIQARLRFFVVGWQRRLDGTLDIHAMFAAPAAESLALVRTCRAVAEGWQAHYLAMREQLEASGHPARWEFSRSLLFEKTNYAAEVCGELEGMLGAVDDFRAFLGPELKTVTGDPGVIDEVSVMVQAMVEPVAGTAFHPFNKAHAAEWRAVRARFARDADDIQLATRDLVDTCFRKLRSVDAAAQLLHSFQRIQAQGAMQQQMADKLAAVLEHFIHEIQTVRRLFEEGRDNPPLTRNQPPVAGAIRWCRSLLGRVRRTWVRLQALSSKVEELDAGRRAAAAMTELARSMLQYEKGRFEQWSTTVDAAVTAGLQQPLLARQEPLDGSSAGMSSAASRPGGNAGSSDRIVVNFPPGLLQLMREAKYLDQLGCAVPQLAVNLALQEGQLREHFRELGAALERHRAAAASLQTVERALLCEQLAALEGALQPGLARLNWTSLTIPQFVEGVNKAVDHFSALVGQVQKNTAQIERTLYAITRARLLPPDAPAPAAAPKPAAAAQGAAAGSEPAQQPASDSSAGQADKQGATEPAEGQGGSPDVPDLQEWYEEFEQHRQQVVEGLVARYRGVGPLLVKVEELVAGTSTGKSPRLAGYYAYWERRLFGAVSSMVVSGLQAFHTRLAACRASGEATEAAGNADSSQPGKPPLFRVSLALLASEVVVFPSTAEASKQLGRLLRNLVESAKPFHRWMDGTCIEAPEQYVYGEDAEPFTFSFFSDVSQSPAVIKNMLQAQHEVQRAAAGVAKVAERWRAFAPLWKLDRAAALSKLRSRRPSLAAAEDKMGQYHQLGQDAWAAGGDCDVLFIRVRCSTLAAAVRVEAQAWVRGIAGVLAEGDAAQLEALQQQAAGLLATVQLQPQEEADVARITGAVEEAQAAAAAATAACEELEESCRARLQYAAPVDAEPMREELVRIAGLQTAWRQLAAAAAERQAQGVELAPQPPVASEATETAPPSGVPSAASSRLGSARLASGQCTPHRFVADCTSSPPTMDDVGLPKSSLQKAIKDALPANMRIAGDASELLVQACNQFVHLISTQANDISERDKRSTISPEHVIKALEELEFGAQYVEAARAALEEWKVENKEHHGKMQNRKQGSGLTQEQLIELQQKLFEEARAATLSGPLPSMVVADVVAAVAAEQPGEGAAAGTAAEAAGQQQQQQQEQQQEQPGSAAAAAPEQPAEQQQQQAAAAQQLAGEAAAVEVVDDDAALSDDEEVQAAVA